VETWDVNLALVNVKWSSCLGALSQQITYFVVVKQPQAKYSYAKLIPQMLILRQRLKVSNN